MDNIESQVKNNRKKFRVDHFDIIISEYVKMAEVKDNEIDAELILNPPYQRLFRWDIKMQSELIESILIGMPVPPIFVFQNEAAKWELIDGLQRTRTLLNFLTKGSKQRFRDCEILTYLNNKTFEELPENIQRMVKNTRLRIELIEESDNIFSQYLMFNRLNSNGEKLEAQEIRNFLIYKLNKAFYNELQYLSKTEEFLSSIHLKKERIDKQENVEYALKFFIGRELSTAKNIVKYDKIEDLLTKETEKYLIKHDNCYLENEYEKFNKTFSIIYKIFGENSFRYYMPNINSIANTFSMAIGISFIIDKIENMDDNDILKKVTSEYFTSDTYKKITSRGYSPTARMYELNEYCSKFYREAF